MSNLVQSTIKYSIRLTLNHDKICNNPPLSAKLMDTKLTFQNYIKIHRLKLKVMKWRCLYEFLELRMSFEAMNS